MFFFAIKFLTNFNLFFFKSCICLRERESHGFLWEAGEIRLWRAAEPLPEDWVSPLRDFLHDMEGNEVLWDFLVCPFISYSKHVDVLCSLNDSKPFRNIFSSCLVLKITKTMTQKKSCHHSYLHCSASSYWAKKKKVTFFKSNFVILCSAY